MDPLESSELYHFLADSVGLGSTDEMEHAASAKPAQPARDRPAAAAPQDSAQTEAEAKVSTNYNTFLFAPIN